MKAPCLKIVFNKNKGFPSFDAAHKKRSFPLCRSSLPEVLRKKGVLKNSAKFTGKHPCQGLFFNEVAGLRPATLLKK